MYVKTGNLRALRHDYVINSCRNTNVKAGEGYLGPRDVLWAPVNFLYPFYIF